MRTKPFVVDIHTHPAFFEAICENEGQLEFRRRMLGLYKTGRAPLQHIYNQMDYAGIDRLVILPEDLTTAQGGTVVSNEEISRLVDISPERFIGFASIDPLRKDAVEALEYAFKELKLSGLKLHPSKQCFYPADDLLDPIYKLCIKYDRPVMFHSGISWEPDALSKYSRPSNFEEVAYRYPELRLCLAHFGWPWVTEAAAIMLKYTNVYADTGLLYFDNAREFYSHVFCRELGISWIDRSLRNQVMFGSNNPRFEQIRMLEALQDMEFRESTLELLLGGNALRFLGMEV